MEPSPVGVAPAAPPVQGRRGEREDSPPPPPPPAIASRVLLAFTLSAPRSASAVRLVEAGRSSRAEAPPPLPVQVPPLPPPASQGRRREPGRRGRRASRAAPLPPAPLPPPPPPPYRVTVMMQPVLAAALGRVHTRGRGEPKVPLAASPADTVVTAWGLSSVGPVKRAAMRLGCCCWPLSLLRRAPSLLGSLKSAL